MPDYVPADLVMQTSPTTGLVAFALAGTVQGFQTFAAAHAIGTVIPCRVKGIGGEWETGRYTLMDTPLRLERTAVVSSSNGNQPVNFSAGTKEIYETVLAADLVKMIRTDASAAGSVAGADSVVVIVNGVAKRVTVDALLTGVGAGGGAAPSDVAFSQAIPLTNTAGAYMASHTVAGPLTFTAAAGAVRGALAYLRLTADGVNLPNFAAFKEWGGSSGYDNRNGIVNQVQFFFDGADLFYTASQAVGATPVVPADTTAPTLTSPTSAPTGQTTGSGSVTTNEANGTLYYLATTNATETAATVKASGATLAITSAGSKAVTVAGLAASTTYCIHFVHRDAAGNDSARVSSASFTTSAAGDSTGPVLSAPTGTQTGSTTANGSVSTDEANGTLYRLASVNAVETAATIKAAALTTPVTATGAQAVSFTGLTASTTYYAHYVHPDATGNDSNVASSAAFTTAAAAESFVRIVSQIGLTESGTGPYAYVGTDAGTLATQQGVADKARQVGIDGHFTIKAEQLTGNNIIVGLQASATYTGYANIPIYLWQSGGKWAGAGGGTAGAVIAPINTDRVRFRWVGTTMYAEIARDADPANFTVVHTWGPVGAANKYFGFNMVSDAKFTIVDSSGLA